MSTLERRLWRRIEYTGFCWLWPGAASREGGQIAIDRVTRYVHHVVWELLIGPVPDGLILSHVCRVPRCCNPDHLEPMTFRECTLRGFSPPALSYRTDLCQRGHPMDGVKGNGTRYCLACNNERNRLYRAGRKVRS